MSPKRKCTLCHVTNEIFLLAEVGVVSAAAAVSVLACKGVLAFDPKGFILKLFGFNVLQYVSETGRKTSGYLPL
jgi:hypothetical protein